MARTITFNVKDADTGLDLQKVVMTVLDAADAVLSTGNTDANGDYTSAAQLATTAYYLTATLAGYISVVKAAAAGAPVTSYFQPKLHWISPTADETQGISILLIPDRARTQCVVYEGAGAGAGAVQTPVAGATVLVKKTSDNSLIETLTTDADGVVFLDETSYLGVPYSCVVSKALYNSNTVYRGNYEAGQSFAVPLQLTIAHTTHNFSLHLIDGSGAPISGKVLKLNILGMLSITDTGEEYYVNKSGQLTLTTDVNGDADVEILEGLVVQPASGWASYFGYPEGVLWIITADVILGDSAAGLI